MKRINFMAGVSTLLLVTSIFAQNPEDQAVKIDGAGEQFSELPQEPEPKSIDEMRSRSERYVNEIRDMLRNGLRQRSDIEKNKKQDIILKSCMDQRLNSLKLLKTMSEDELHRLREAVEFQAESSAKKSFSKLQKLRERATRSVSNMQRCVGETATYTGGATLDVQDQTERQNSTLEYYEGDGSNSGSNSSDAAGRFAAGTDVIGGNGGEFTRPQTASRAQ